MCLVYISPKHCICTNSIENDLTIIASLFNTASSHIFRIKEKQENNWKCIFTIESCGTTSMLA
jgi:hypothetical protein